MEATAPAFFETQNRAFFAPGPAETNRQPVLSLAMNWPPAAEESVIDISQRKRPVIDAQRN